MGSGFEITVHRADRILEVRYPQHPTEKDVNEYLRAARLAIDTELAGKPWRCLVDQLSLAVMPPELAAQVATLNEYAEEKGMACCARVVSTAVGALQVARIARSVLGVPVKAFRDRAAAMAWLREAK
jgi:hypothetical protein